MSSDVQQKLEELKAIIESGAKAVTVDNTRVEYDLQTVRRLIAQLEDELGQTKRRSVVHVDLRNT